MAATTCRANNSAPGSGGSASAVVASESTVVLPLQQLFPTEALLQLHSLLMPIPKEM